ncbi:peptidoglycan recognition protein family protein [Pseudonocardia abyssalis]|uniref:N-acetylmuramoyl-L-alanine amidase n=1 Tax=Pseudonocardia abyssalis TaxID=2792008 RepID=A0ABS6UZ70_9PSEU|nr:N-acetylmuramoyl-L-alanine amidase [Pseudonocardia abyssalis]MBW0116568.1 N-acetylmuramoyl-L-alanine amidase [Pseudonocardia abyssalis]MBW0137541.1 N-acetylmuramoyl-L-alanine amidase [Pseudonocardia abyssalis]
MGAARVTRRGFLLGGAALLALPGTALAATAPEIADCAAWGARPNSRVVNVVVQRPVKILVHHTATPNVTDLSRGAADALARGIQNFHMDRRGWLDSGQHFTISRGGFVLEGRHRSLEALRNGRKQVEGAHCTGQNLVSIGIENEGTYMDTEPTGVLWDRLREMCAYICGQYGIAPTEIYGHRDFKDTLCPGDVLYGMLPRLRGEVGGMLGQRLEGSSVRAASWPVLREDDRGPVVEAAQRLLRGAGRTEVAVDGTFSAAMAESVRVFQAEHATEEVNGIIGGESWPLLAAPVQAGDGGEAAEAVETLAATSSTRPPSRVGPEQWQQLLTAAR